MRCMNWKTDKYVVSMHRGRCVYMQFDVTFDAVHDMFYDLPYNLDARSAECMKTFGVNTQYDWAAST